MFNFSILGLGGYIAPRHLKAIKETGHQLLCGYDKADNVGIIDSYFPNASFFTEFERFDRFVDKSIRDGKKLDYVSVCTPNYLHDSHIRFGLKHHAHVICEKPIVLNTRNLLGLMELEKETGKQVYTILQLRHHPALIELKKKIDNAPKDKIFDVDLTYITSRGLWYYTSWKGDVAKSGGIATNIGVHFFDMLCWIFGKMKKNEVHQLTHDRAAGYLELERARVKWFLSINYDTIPEHIKKSGARTYRSLLMDGEEIQFSEGFTDLHTVSYANIINGTGFGLKDAFSSIEIVEKIRTDEILGIQPYSHALAHLPMSKHPFNK